MSVCSGGGRGGAGREFHSAQHVQRGKVAGVNGGAVTLDEALAGGIPVVGAGVQKITGFVDREGGSYFQEWSGCS